MDKLSWIVEGLREKEGEDGLMVGFKLDEYEVFVGTGPQDPNRHTIAMSGEEQKKLVRALHGLQQVRDFLTG